MTLLRPALLFIVLSSSCSAAPVSALGVRGYAVLPQPQRVILGPTDFRFGPGWGLARKGVSADDAAVTSFNEGLHSRFRIAPLGPVQGGGALTMVVAPGSVAIGDALDSDKRAIAEQAYQI